MRASSGTNDTDGVRAGAFSLEGTYRDEAAEAAFRAAGADSICRRARLTALIGAVVFAAALPYDYESFAGQAVFWVLLALRLGAVGAALWFLWLTRRPGAVRDRHLGAALLAFEAYIVVAFLVVVFLHGGQVSFHTMSALTIVLVFYVFLPTLSRAQFLLPPVFSAVFLACFAALLGTPVPELSVPAVILLLGNVLGAQSARTGNRTQRLEHQSLLAQQDLNGKLRVEIAERKIVEQRLRESDETFRRLFDASPVPMMLTAMDDGTVLRANDLALRLFGVEGKDVSRLRASDFYVRAEDRARLVEQVEHQGHVGGKDARLRAADGVLLEVLLAASRIDYEGRAAMLVGVMDISTQKRIQRQFKRLANVDPLTGIGNRRSFFLAVSREMRRARRNLQPISVMLIDVDNFKQVNDRFGHATGDRVLHRVAGVLHEELREFDVLGRVGGEEFAILLPGLALADAMDVAERLRMRIAALSLQGDDATPLSVTVSIGVSDVDADAGSIEDALGRADQAMYTAKHEGRNRVACS